MRLPRHVSALLDPRAYPHPVAEVALHQTHISWVLVAGDFAYKLKKPVRLAFLDYSTLEERETMCRREVTLNQRLCPDVYLGTVPVIEVDGAFRLGRGPGKIVDWAVRMRRLPADRMLDRLLAARAVGTDDVAAIARRLATFHAEARSGSPLGGPETVWQNWDENLAELVPYVGRTLDADTFAAIGERAREMRAREAQRLARRTLEGRVRDGHGDVRAENICLAGGEPLIFDCIEFSDRLRCADVASEVAFLAMDLDWWERPDLRAAWVDAYVDASGDEELCALLPWFESYRAVVRGKVESFRLDDPGFDEAARAASADRARRYFTLALALPRRSRPTLIAVGGLSGTGKSTLARALAARLGCRLLSSDVVRKELAGLAPDVRAGSPLGEGLYAPDAVRRTYAALREQAANELAGGRSVVVDATFVDTAERDAVREVAARYEAGFVPVECSAPASVVRERLAARSGDASDADWSVYRAQVARTASVPPDSDRVLVDSTVSLEDQVARVLRALD